MNYRNLLAILILMLCGRANAQKVFHAGLSAGLVTSQISGDGLGGWDKFGFAGGGWVRAELKDPWSATIGIQFVQKGSRTKRDTLNFQTFAFHLNYIEVPITAGYRLKKWQFNLGPYAGVLISQKIIANKLEYAPNPPFERFDIGATFSAQFMLSEHLGLEIRGSSSVLPTRPSPNFANPLSYYERGNYNQVLQFLLNLKI